MRVLTWLRERPLVADVLLALALAVITVAFVLAIQSSEILDTADDLRVVDHPLEWLLVISLPMTLALRRRVPILAVAMAVAIQATIWVLGVPDFTLATVIALYSAVVHGRRPWGFRAALVGGVGLWFLTVTGFIVGSAPAYVVLIVPLMVTGPLVLGRQTLERRAEVDRLRHEALERERRRETERRSAMHAERTRIARELHDVVAHGLSVMVVQAAAGRRVIDDDPDGARRALELIEESGRQSLTDMRRVLGLLREDEPVDPDRTGRADERWHPNPGLPQLESLADGLRDLGHVVSLACVGDLDAIPQVLGTSAYRIVQEATTNIIKHAGPALDVDIRAIFDGVELRLEVCDDGRGAAAPATGGHGITGMTERVEIFGGTLRTGPRRGGGFEVVATIPVAERPVVDDTAPRPVPEPSP